MVTIYLIVVGFFLFSVAMGFGLGWFVRGGEVKKLKAGLKNMKVTVTGVHHSIKPGDVAMVLDVVGCLEEIPKKGSCKDD